MYEPTDEIKIGNFIIKGEDFSIEGKREVNVNGIDMVRVRILSKMSWIKNGTIWFNNECKPYLPKVYDRYIMALKYNGENLENGWTVRKCVTCDNHVRIPPSFLGLYIEGAMCYENCLKDKYIFPNITFIDMENGISNTGTVNIANDYEAYRSSAIKSLLERHNVTQIDAEDGNFSIYYYFNPKKPGIVLFFVRKEDTIQVRDIQDAWSSMDTKGMKMN